MASPSAALPESGYIKTAEVLSVLPVRITRRTLVNWSKSDPPKFPRPMRMGPRLLVWEVNAVRRWLSQYEARHG